MKKLMKKLLTIACCFALCMVVLTGCSWLKIDNYKYYNAVVASIGDKDFTKRDLINAYNSYGYQYYQNFGQSMEDAINTTIGSMIDRYLLLEEIKANPSYQLTDNDKLEIKATVFDYMQDSIFTYEEQIRKEWDKTVDTEEETEEKEGLRKAEEEYTAKTYYEEGVVYRLETEEETDTPILDGSITLDSHFSKSMQVVTDKKVSDEAWTRYVKALQDGAESEGRDTAEAAVLLYEENRLIDTMTSNKYLEKYKQDYYDNLPIDTDAVLSYFRTQYNKQRTNFSANKSLYHKAMENAASEFVYYHVNSGNEYVNVKHILVNFSDAQKEAIKALNTEYGIANDYTEEDETKKQNATYKAKLDKIVAQTTSTFEMDGEEHTWNAINSSDGQYSVWEFVQSQVTGSTLQERCEQFNKLVYIFNDDGGFMNSEFDYVVNLDTDVEDKMVKPFANGVRALDASSNGEDGKWLNATDGGEGAGSMDYIISEYGIHIIFHAGNAANLIDYNMLNNDEELLRLLCTTYTTPESNKSIFNMIWDKLDPDSSAYDIKSQADINTIKTRLAGQGVEIVYYEDNYKDMWK